MSDNEVAEAIRRTRRTLTRDVWVPDIPDDDEGGVCAVTAIPPDDAADDDVAMRVVNLFAEEVGWRDEDLDDPVDVAAGWNDRQTDVGAVLGMTLQALIAELCKPTLAPRTTEA